MTSRRPGAPGTPWRSVRAAPGVGVRPFRCILAAPPRPRQASKPVARAASGSEVRYPAARDHRRSSGAIACEPDRRALRRARRLVHDRDVRRGRPSAGRTSWSRRSAAMPDRSTWSPTSAVNGYTSADLIRDELPAPRRPATRLRHAPHRRQRRRPGRAPRDVRGATSRRSSTRSWRSCRPTAS